jgi:hypothetical protein
MKRFILILGLPMLLAAMAGCGGSSGGDGGGANDTLAVDTDTQEETDRVVKSFPSPVQMAQLLKNAGATYTPTLLNDPARVRAYQTTNSRALNLGVYSADMAYANTFEKRQTAMKYFTAVRRLSDDLGLENVFTKALENKIEQYEDDQDSLVRVFSKTLAKIKNQLHDADQPEVLNLMFTGAFVEGLHVATSIYQTTPSEDLGHQIAEQKMNHRKLMEYMKPLEGKAGMAEVIGGLKQIGTAYAAIEVSYQSPDQPAQPSRQGVTVIGGTNQIKVTKADIQNLHEAVSSLRTQIIQTPEQS